MVKRYALIFSLMFLMPQAYSMTRLSSLWNNVASCAAPLVARVHNPFRGQSITSKLTQLANSRFAGYCTFAAMACASIVGAYVVTKKLLRKSDNSNHRPEIQEYPGFIDFGPILDAKYSGTPISNPQNTEQTVVVPKANKDHLTTDNTTTQSQHTQNIDSEPQSSHDQSQDTRSRATLPADKASPSVKTTPDHVEQPSHVEHQETLATTKNPPVTSMIEGPVVQSVQKLIGNPYFNDRSNHAWDFLNFNDAQGRHHRVQQLLVLPQSRENGGDGSCALHAILRANPAIALIVQGKMSPGQAKGILQETKMNFEPAKKFIVDLRTKKALNRYYLKRLTRISCADRKARQDEVIYSIYDRLVGQTVDFRQEQVRSLDPVSLKDYITVDPSTHVGPEQLALFSMSTEQFITFMNQADTWTRYINVKQGKVLKAIHGKLLTMFIDKIIAKTSSKPFTLAPENIIEDINANASSIKFTTEELFWFNHDIVLLKSQLHNPEIMNNYIALDKPLEVLPANIGHAWREYNHEVQPPMDQGGQWLDDGECTALIAHARSMPESDLAQAYNEADVKTCTIGSPEQFESDGTIRELKSALQERRMPQHKFYAFHLGNMSQAKAASTGHYISLFLEVAQQQLRWTIANSAHNHIQLFGDSPATQLIKHIVGESSHTTFNPTPEFREHNAQVLREALQSAQSEIDEGTSRPLFASRLPEYKDCVADKLKRLDHAATTFHTFNRDYSKFGGSKEVLDQRIHQLNLQAATLN